MHTYHSHTTPGLLAGARGAAYTTFKLPYGLHTPCYSGRLRPYVAAALAVAIASHLQGIG